MSLGESGCRSRDLPCSRLKLSTCHKMLDPTQPGKSFSSHSISTPHTHTQSETKQGREATAKCPPAPQNWREVIFRACVFLSTFLSPVRGTPSSIRTGLAFPCGWCGHCGSQDGLSSQFKPFSRLCTSFLCSVLVPTEERGVHIMLQKSPGETSSSHSNLSRSLGLPGWRERTAPEDPHPASIPRAGREARALSRAVRQKQLILSP